jgi:hypothetical protein
MTNRRLMALLALLAFPAGMLLGHFVFGDSWGGSAHVGLDALLAVLLLAGLDWLRGLWDESRNPAPPHEPRA